MIALAVITGSIALAKRGRGKRRMGKYIRGTVDEDLGIGTLASKTLTSIIFDEVVNERTLVSSVVATYSMSNWTSIASVGPILVGLAHSDYSNAEIEEFLETTGSWNEGDLVQTKEVAKRLVRRIGILDATPSLERTVTMNDGKAIKTKLNWVLLQGQSLRLWAYNTGTANVATTVPNVHAAGHANLWPK